MKYLENQDLNQLPGQRLKETDRFSFRCHSSISCFNRCCRNLNLFLYPYDVIRLKKHLSLTSDRFLDEHADIVMRPDNFFPEVLLRMAEDPERSCPFSTETGCSVYLERPYSCRMFPVEQGALFDGKRIEMVHFFRPPDFCMGRYEAWPNTTESWKAGQEAAIYTKMTTDWSKLKLLFQKDPWGTEGPNGRRAKMAFMAAYNVDRFREFVFQSSFLKRYRVEASVRNKIAIDDSALLEFGIEWIKFFLWGIPSRDLKIR
ncbi:MAG: YkgJ family cysteine cluster protein [Desulfobacteraceae bacterium]|nr:MAG: YkgJ family cysteine cluster protein [Desulfobacteraceae bacterium]